MKYTGKIGSVQIFLFTLYISYTPVLLFTGNLDIFPLILLSDIVIMNEQVLVPKLSVSVTSITL